MNSKDRYIMPNLLNQQFVTAKRNKRWSIDDTVIPIGDGSQKLKVLLIIDLATKCILNTLVTLKDFNAAHVARAVDIKIRTLGIEEFDDPQQRLIIHTDRDTHFTSKTWVDLQIKHPKLIRLSMSPMGTPIENAVSERLNGTMKHLAVPELQQTFGQPTLSKVLQNLKPGSHDISFYKKLVSAVVNHYNTKHIHRDLKTSPSAVEDIHITCEPKVAEPLVIATRNNGSSPLEDRIAVQTYKKTLAETYSETQKLLNEQELNQHDRFLIKQIEQIVQSETKKLATLSQAQFINLSDKLEQIDEKLSQIKEKSERKRRKHNTIALRDPLVYEFYEKLLNYFPKGLSPSQIVHFAQMKIICVTLYVTGARVNEIRFLTKEDLQKVLDTGILSLKQTKTNEYRNVYLGDNAIKEFLKVKPAIDYLFEELNFAYLGCSLKNREEAMDKRSWIRKVNTFLKQVKESLGINLQLKSHSFRIGFVNSILLKSDISKAAELVGHKSLDTTRRYLRYQNNTPESREFLDNALGLDQKEKNEEENT